MYHGKGRRSRSDIDGWLEAWARWCYAGGLNLTSGASMLARMIDGCGVLTFGSGGPSVPLDTIEAHIEATVIAMARVDQLRADVLRLEYAAGWEGVVSRRGFRDYDPRGMGQVENAAALGVSVRTYRRRLAEARHTITEGLK